MRSPNRLRFALQRRIREPWIVLVPLVVAQWAAVGVFAAVVRHNGWLFYQGGDETFFYTDAWTIAHGHIPESEIGYGWSYLLAPVARIFGPSYLAALPVLVVFQTVVLLPVALLCVYAIAARAAGRLAGYGAALLWVAVPFLLIPLFDGRYHARYVEQFLPQAFGLTGLGDFPSTVCLLLAALACMRAIDGMGPIDGALGGLAAGFAIAIKPSNALFLAGPLLALPAARRFRALGSFGLALIPALAGLALWKYRGLGHLPILSPAPKALGAVAPLATADVLPYGVVVSRYVHVDWDRLRENYVQLREFLPAAPALLVLPVGGFWAAMLRSRPKALLLGGWLGAFLLVKGGSDRANIESGTLLRLFMPGFPPLLILGALAPLLFVRSKYTELTSRPIDVRVVAVVAAVFAAAPLVLFAALPALRSRTVVKYFDEHVMVPVESAFSVAVKSDGARAVVSWENRPRGAHVYYRVFRVRPVVAAPDPTLPPGIDGIRCYPISSGYAAAADCRLEALVVGVSRSTRFVDMPPPGPWVYRVGLAANWRDDPAGGDVLLLSGPGRLPSR